MRFVSLSKSKKYQHSKEAERAAPHATKGSAVGMRGIAAGKLQSIVKTLRTQGTLIGCRTEKNNQRSVQTCSNRSAKNQRRNSTKKTMQSAYEETVASTEGGAAERLQSTAELFPTQETLTGSGTGKNYQSSVKLHGSWIRKKHHNKTAKWAK